MEGQLNSVQKSVKDVKIITVGDTGVGKTLLLQAYVQEVQQKSGNQTTIGVDFFSKHVQHKGKSLRLYLYDTAGQERYRCIIRRYYTNADGVLIVFSLDDWYQQSSFKSQDKISPQHEISNNSYSNHFKSKTKTALSPLKQIKDWIIELKEHGLSTASILLIATKKDLIQEVPDRQEFLKHVKQQLQVLKNQMKTELFFTSAMTGQNVEEAFRCLIGKIYTAYQEKQQLQSMQQQRTPQRTPKSIIIEEQDHYQQRNVPQGNKSTPPNTSPAQKKRKCF